MIGAHDFDIEHKYGQTDIEILKRSIRVLEMQSYVKSTRMIIGTKTCTYVEMICLK